MAGELLRQQDLISIFAAQPIPRVDQDGLKVALGGEITQPLQSDGCYVGTYPATVSEFWVDGRFKGMLPENHIFAFR
ncbi:hypothetical protein Rhsp01_49210 [Rhizobium sp. NBRC 114257]|uniref:Uncharacterized protein n=1 Tax=Rhizobium dioscoreae TaxID=2653122 RepID=A0ABQ0ZA95_9HYPH|nr:hypothetical protein RsS93_50340 [Rhizobium dioscoreae]GLU83745.1 hypothetical protein Rhsp01_49210 [Rhizobium sp. NBRC 114257]